MEHYIHQNTGMIAVPVNTSFYRIEDVSEALIPIQLITQSDEWNVIKRKKLFTSEDGVDIYEGDSWTYVTLTKNPKVGRTSTLVYAGNPENIVETKRFADGRTAQLFANLLRTPITYFELESAASELKLSKATLSLIRKKFIKQ